MNDFETLIYTDCRPGQGLTGSGGLQFQARSSARASAAATAVRNFLLYEPPTSWMRETRPVADYPPSFAHTAQGHFATARGVYLGKEANGNREGNQLTHAVVTEDVDTYGLVRPAQLFGAPFWATEPAPTTTSPGLALPDEFGEFGVEAIRERFLDEPATRPMLVALVSALLNRVRRDGPRILFLADDCAEVVRWLAAATLLLPRREALGLSFKVFVTDPSRAQHDVVGVNTAWGASASTVAMTGRVVFDLLESSHQPVDEDESALLWVGHFFDEDPHDVLDALEIATTSELDPRPAAALAWAVVAGRPVPAVHLPVLVDWFPHGSAKSVGALGNTVFDVLKDTLTGEVEEVVPGEASVDRSLRQTAEDLGVIARAIGAGRVPARAAELWIALADAEIAALGAGWSVPADDLTALGRAAGDETRLSVRQTLLNRLKTSGVPGFEPMLRLARRHLVSLSGTELAEAAATFVVDWADHPKSYDVSRWVDGNMITARLRDELLNRIKTGRATEEEIGEAWWKFLPPDADGLDDLGDALQQAVVASAMRHFSPQERLELAERYLDVARSAGRPTSTLAMNTLWRLTPAAFEEVALLCDTLPEGVTIPSRILQTMLDALLKDPDHIDVAWLNYAHELCEQKLLPPFKDLEDLLKWDSQLNNRGKNPEATPQESLSSIPFDDYPPALLLARGPEFVHDVLALEHQKVGLVLPLLPPPLWDLAVNELRDRLSRGREPWLALTAASLLVRPPRNREFRAATEENLRQILDQWAGKASGKDRRRVAEDVKDWGRSGADLAERLLADRRWSTSSLWRRR